MLYMLKFNPPIGSDRHSAKYYLGWAKNVEARVEHHRRGQGASITRAAVEKGSKLELVGVIEGDKTLERQLKNRRNHKKLVAAFERGAL